MKDQQKLDVPSFFPPATPPPAGAAHVDVYEPARIALEGGGIGRVAFSTTHVTPDDIQALIDVLVIQKRQLERMRRRGEDVPLSAGRIIDSMKNE